MRTYRNRITGAVIEASGELVGGGWELVEDQPAAEPQEGGKSPDSAKKSAKTVKSKAAVNK